jgi:hypothetical protein
MPTRAAGPTHYAELIAALEVARMKLPPLYRTAAAEPFLTPIKDLGAAKLAQVLSKDPQRESTVGLMIDIAQAIVQNGEGYHATPLAGKAIGKGRGADDRGDQARRSRWPLFFRDPELAR